MGHNRYEAFTDRELLALCAQRDERAWTEIYRRYRWFVWSVARGFYRLDHATAEDVAFAVWGQLVRHCTDDITNLAGWLHRVTYNQAVTVWRKQKRQIPSEFEFDLEDLGAPLPEDVALENELRQALVAAFNRLSPACQRVLRVVFFEGHESYDEIAVALGRPKGSVGPTRKRCVEQLARLVEQAMIFGGWHEGETR